MEDELMTIKEIAQYLKVTRRTIMNYRNLKVSPIPCIKARGMLLFNKNEVIEWLERFGDDE